MYKHILEHLEPHDKKLHAFSFPIASACLIYTEQKLRANKVCIVAEQKFNANKLCAVVPLSLQKRWLQLEILMATWASLSTCVSMCCMILKFLFCSSFQLQGINFNHCMVESNMDGKSNSTWCEHTPSANLQHNTIYLVNCRGNQFLPTTIFVSGMLLINISTHTRLVSTLLSIKLSKMFQIGTACCFYWEYTFLCQAFNTADKPLRTHQGQLWC